MEKRAEAHHVDYRMITPMSRPTFTFSSSFGKRLARLCFQLTPLADQSFAPPGRLLPGPLELRQLDHGGQ